MYTEQELVDITKNFFDRNKIQYEELYIHEGLSVNFRVGDLCFDCIEPDMLNSCEEFRDCYKDKHIVVITETGAENVIGKPNGHQSNGLKYLKKCPHPLIGVDIELFKEHPDFPYRDDRPSCFYDVRVDGKPSAHEAFYNEEIRWKMIVNRILYSGGFIDNKQVLQAMNISRTCKQPSWFTVQRAKDIINKYCTSTTIVDPFAGWGARHDAAAQLKRPYLGGDYNKKLVQWHQSKGRTITYADANEFKYDGICSIFICPPYSDPKTGRCFEDYNFDNFDESAKSLSQCDWLKICMRNIPNATEYVMVCKVVDVGWDKYIVDTITNKSHFGKNNEYVLVVPNAEAKVILLSGGDNYRH